jgi:hypothetical protein
LHKPQKLLDIVIVMRLSPVLNVVHLIRVSVDSMAVNDMPKAINGFSIKLAFLWL